MNSSQSKQWGLFPKDSHLPIPLKSLHISINIINNVAKVLYTQVYYNQSEALLETEFFFPISPDACFDSFSARFNDTTIQGAVKEKQEAQEEYKEALEAGRTAAYSEINKETGDIMKVMIGNIPPESEISVTYSYIQKLETTLNKFWCFRLFSSMTPRYHSPDFKLNQESLQDVNLLASYPLISEHNPEAYPWTIEAEVQLSSPITFLKSPTHEITTTYGNENHTCKVILSPESKHMPNKDFVLVFSGGQKDKVNYFLTPYEEGYCAMLNFLVDFEEELSEEAIYAKALGQVNEEYTPKRYKLNDVRGEYFFLIDRSGSMKGSRIDVAKSSLILFLKSLPKDSRFNIISFGSSHHSIMQESSVAYSEQTLETAVLKVEQFKADMGGTEIFQALQNAIDLPSREGYPRFIFLLTDGAVSNTYQVLDLIKLNSHKAQIFTIGIGNGCSAELITKAALYGRGKHEFVADGSDLHEKVIGLLNASFSPCYSDISLEAENFDAWVESVSPNPASIPWLLNGETATFFMFLQEWTFEEKKTMKLQLKFYDSRIHDKRTIEIVLGAEEAIKNDFVPKLAIHDMIKRIEDEEKDKSSIQAEVKWLSKENFKKEMVALSLKYGILCQETAFICEVQEKDKKFNREIEKIKAIVPSLRETKRVIRFPTEVTGYSRSGGKKGRRTKATHQGAADDKKLCAVLKKMPLGGTEGLGLYYSAVNNSLQNKDLENISSISNLNIEDNKTDLEARRQWINDFYALNEGNALPKKTVEYYDKDKKHDLLLEKSDHPSYKDVVRKQRFDGYWNPEDTGLCTMILGCSDMPSVPEKIQKVAGELAAKVWMTVLVLTWLEVFWSEQKAAWYLIACKGQEWLEAQGIKFEEFKETGETMLNSYQTYIDQI